MGCTQHRRLPPAIGVATKKNLSRNMLTHDANRIPQPLAIAFRIAWERRAGSPLLAKGQIAAENDIAIFRKSLAERHEQRSRTIRPSAMRQDQRVAIGIPRGMQKTANSGFS